MSGLHIGLDLDNTIICYDRAFVEVGMKIGLLPRDHGLRTKIEVKSFLYSPARGEHDWMYLQGQVYGRYIDRAHIYDGLPEFLRAMRAQGARFSIVSHKTRHGHFDPLSVDLWDAAVGWLERQTFFAETGFSIDRNDVHFLETRDEKIARIETIRCDVFVDDLPEVLLHPRFPSLTIGLWFAPNNAGDESGLVSLRSWGDILVTIERIAARRVRETV